jgi:hypothetical protein
MFMGEKRRVSASAAIVGLVSLLLAVGLMIAEAVAHHPGSHASRRSDGQIRLDVAANLTDSCTTIASVSRGAPPNAQPPSGADPVLVRLQRPAEAVCAQVVRTARAETVLDTPRGIAALHLFHLAADGRVAATERVPIR